MARHINDFLPVKAIREFEYRGYQCAIVDSPFGSPNGYVIGEFGSWVTNADVVNQVFWEQSLVGSNGEWTFFDRVGDESCIGFDTGHAHDIDDPKDSRWVEEEIKRGVDNLIATNFLQLQDDLVIPKHTGDLPLTLGLMIAAMRGSVTDQEATS